MDEIRFEWDPNKARANLRKHSIAFSEASTAFFDEYALVVADPEHSRDEERFVLLGLSVTARLLVVIHCLRSDEEVIRIISARRASPSESRQYEASVKR